MKVRFSEGNRLAYGQNTGYWHGIPAGVVFDVESLPGGLVLLRADGYGRLEQPQLYGNGALHVTAAVLGAGEVVEE